jgi:hypothetical protein
MCRSGCTVAQIEAYVLDDERYRLARRLWLRARRATAVGQADALPGADRPERPEVSPVFESGIAAVKPDSGAPALPAGGVSDSADQVGRAHGDRAEPCSAACRPACGWLADREVQCRQRAMRPFYRAAGGRHRAQRAQRSQGDCATMRPRADGARRQSRPRSHQCLPPGFRRHGGDRPGRLTNGAKTGLCGKPDSRVRKTGQQSPPKQRNKQSPQMPHARPPSFDPSQRELPLLRSMAASGGAHRRILDDIEREAARRPEFNVSGSERSPSGDWPASGIAEARAGDRADPVDARGDRTASADGKRRVGEGQQWARGRRWTRSNNPLAS